MSYRSRSSSFETPRAGCHWSNNQRWIVDAGGLWAHLILPASGIDLEMLPTCPGLAALGRAVKYALPLVLDAIAGLDAANPAYLVGQALGTLGDALAVRTGGQFSATELQTLAANPGPEPARRLAADRPRDWTPGRPADVGAVGRVLPGPRRYRPGVPP